MDPFILDLDDKMKELRKGKTAAIQKRVIALMKRSTAEGEGGEESDHVDSKSFAGQVPICCSEDDQRAEKQGRVDLVLGCARCSQTAGDFDSEVRRMRGGGARLGCGW